jgi:glycine/sarcosine N-methyltransferase
MYFSQRNIMNTQSTPEEFYDSLAPQYDAMTNFTARLGSEALILQPLVDEFNIRRAADMGCGTGLHVLALSTLGVDAAGFDISANMIREAVGHAAELALPARFTQGSFLAPELEDAEPFDAVLCLGNSLPHVPDIGALKGILAYWKRCLRSEGVIIIQLLNYLNLLRSKERIVGIRKTGPVTTVRFYDFTEPYLTFNILTIREEGGRITHALQSTRLLPLTKDDLASAAIETGFSKTDWYSSLKRDLFSEDAKDLVVVLRK